MQAALRKKDRFVWLSPPRSLGTITVADVAEVSTAVEHNAKVRAWAESAWSAWAEHHDAVRNWLATRK
jgi:hypothetical protein